MTNLASLSIEFAQNELGVHENSRNWSPRIGEYLASVGWNQPAPWCAAFACWCIKQAARELQIIPQMEFGLSTQKLWLRNRDLAIPLFDGNHHFPDMDLSGCLALRRDGAVGGHTMIIVGDTQGDLRMLQTISGNTFSHATLAPREGDCVARHTIPISQLARGYGIIRIA